MLQFKEIEVVSVICPRCGCIHRARKENCKSFDKYPNYHEARVLCTGDNCDGLNGKIWHWLNGADVYITGKVIEESYNHPDKYTIPY